MLDFLRYIVFVLALLMATFYKHLTRMFSEKPYYSRNGRLKTIALSTGLLSYIYSSLFAGTAFVFSDFRIWNALGVYSLLIFFVGLPLLMSIMIGANMEQACIIDEDGIYTRKVLCTYKYYSFDEIEKYAKVIKPFICDRCLNIYMGTFRLVYDIRYSRGGETFLYALSDKFNLNFDEMQRQIYSDVPSGQGRNMQCLLLEQIKAEKKRLRQENRNRE